MARWENLRAISITVTNMNIEIVPIDSVFEDPANARVHSEKQIQDIAKSLDRFGQQYPLVVTNDKIIRKGNGTHRAAKFLGWETIAIVWSTLDDYEARAYGIADNKLGTASEWDMDVLAANMKDLVSWNPQQDWNSIGFEKEEITPLLGQGWEGESTPLTDFGDDQDKKENDAPEMGKPIKVTQEMREIINLAVNMVRLEEGDANMTEGRALELICADFIGGAHQTAKLKDEQSK